MTDYQSQQAQSKRNRELEDVLSSVTAYTNGLNFHFSNSELHEFSDGRLLLLRRALAHMLDRSHDYDWSPEDVLASVDAELVARGLV